MAPPPGPSSSSTTRFGVAPPPLTRGTTLPIQPDRSLLAPEDAIYLSSPPKKQSAVGRKLHDLRLTNGGEEEPLPLSRRGRSKGRTRSGSRKPRRTWKKLMWVKQSYPDNYTDQNTFLEHLQFNPALQPYEFWPLAADSTVIVQHVCSVIIFVVCFVGIVQEHISPISVVGWGSIGTVAGWILWDWWVGHDEEEQHPDTPKVYTQAASAASSVSNLRDMNASSSVSNLRDMNASSSFANLKNAQGSLIARHSHSASASSIQSTVSNDGPPHRPMNPSTQFSHRTSLRLSTAKSALLIYFTLLGLSPILKSLTRSTSSDSIWAMSFLLFTINIFFFDYGTPAPAPSSLFNATNKNIPASLSTNAALMASTVLASRLPSTGQVFSLTLFSIEVFGLFPVFRRYAKQRSWRLHLTLTTLLVLGAGGGVGLILGRGGDGEGIWDFPYKSGLIGVVVGVLVAALSMGGCSWWLIGLQKYKNEIRGPWDPARPVIRRRWDEY